jgi:hypothetical protein
MPQIRDWSGLWDGRDAADIEADRAQVALYASLCRAIAGAPIENKLRVFGLMAKTGAAYTGEFRQRVIDDLWEVANDLGLVSLFGVTSVQNVLASAFAEGTS